MILSGKIEVFKNKRGYITGVIKSFNKDKKCDGKCFLDVVCCEGVELNIEDGVSLTLDVKTAYLNCRHVELKEGEAFDRLEVALKDFTIVSSFNSKR